MQLVLARAIYEATYVRGVSPTLTELCTAAGCKSTGTVRDILEGLLRRGLVEREAAKARGLRLTEAGVRMLANG